MSTIDFTGKRYLIAGIGGIGSAIVEALYDLGAQLVLMDISDVNINNIVEKYGSDRVRGYVCDFSDVLGIEPVVKRMIAEVGPVDGFVYAAGLGFVRPLKMCKYDFMRNVMDVNFFAFIEMVRIISARGNRNPLGMNIVGISALGALMGNSTKTAYCASKGAMNAAVRCLAKELAPRSIRVNTVAPGVTDTKMFRDAQDYGAGSEAFRQIEERQYLGVCEPSDIADAVVFLLSGMSHKITGCCLPVDGGKLTS